MRVFFDTSALTKRYVEEEGSEQVRALCAQADSLGVSVLVFPELISTLCRLVREGRLSAEDYKSLKAAVQVDLSEADLCDVSQEIFEQAIRCLEAHSLRTLDALHVGSALIYQPDLFVSADRRQTEAADREGIPVLPIGRAKLGGVP